MDEYVNPFGATFLQDKHLHEVVELRERVAELEKALMQSAVAHHSHMKHEGYFEDCGYLNCKKARLILDKGQS